jgi:hypothetical protein
VSPEQPERGSSYLWFVAVGLALYCLFLTAVTGDIGFNGDDWWVLALPYWNNFPDAVALYAHKFLRPLEGLYWISLFKLFGFNKMAFHLCSLLLLAGSAMLMAVSLDRAFPGKPTYVSIAALLAFFLPTVSCLTYVMFTDNSRLSMLLFWASVIAFQRWAQKSSSWRGLALPVALYMGSFLTYETASFLIFAVPLLVWPVHRRCSCRRSDKVLLARLCVGILTTFVAAVAIRFFFLQGGAVAQGYLLPPFELLWSYLALLPFYLFAPFSAMSADPWALLAGLLVVMGTASLLFFPGRGWCATEMKAGSRVEQGSVWYLVTLGAGVILLGMLPYQLAGYGSGASGLVDTLTVKCGLLPQRDLSWFNFTWASRIYSSASFGVAIVLAAVLDGWRKPSVRLLGKIMAVVVICFMAVFHAGLSQDWREAAEIRNDLMRSLVSQVPAVKSGTNFVFLDIGCSHKRAEVIRQESDGFRELLWMLYSDHSLRAWRLYPHAYDRYTGVCHQAVAMPSGFLCGAGQRQNEPAPPDSLLLFKRSGRELVLLDRITPSDRSVPTGIAWRGVECLKSNVERVEAWRGLSLPEVRLARTRWTSGLMSTLQLTRPNPTLACLRGARYGIAHDARRSQLFQMRLHRVKAHL